MSELGLIFGIGIIIIVIQIIFRLISKRPSELPGDISKVFDKPFIESIKGKPFTGKEFFEAENTQKITDSTVLVLVKSDTYNLNDMTGFAQIFNSAQKRRALHNNYLFHLPGHTHYLRRGR